MSVDLGPWRDQAVAETTAALYAVHPELERRFGVRGRQACREDIGHHLDYLQAALDCDDPGTFLAYARWLADLLERRGMTGGHVQESIALLSAFFQRHLPPDAAARVTAILTAAQPVPHDLPAPYGHNRLPDLPRTPDYLAAALRGDQAAALGVLSEAMRGADLTAAAVGMVQPALYEVGKLWQQNRISVAQEHLVTAVSQNVLAHAYLEAEFATPNERRAVLACVPGNHHSLGLRMLSDALETAGWETAYLGADVPVTDLIRLLDERRPHLLALSLCLPTQLATARQAIARIRAELGGQRPEIWVGGLATLGNERLWHTLDADGWASDALHALEQVK